MGGSPRRLLRFRPEAGESVARVLGGRPTEADGVVLGHLLRIGAVDPIWPAEVGLVRMASVEVVIPVRDDASGVARLLALVPPEVATCVVDDGSEPVLARHDQPRWIRCERAGGPGAARNAGWRTSTAEVIVFVDADVEPLGDWLAMILAHFEDPSVAAVAPRVCGPPAPSGWLERYEHLHCPLDMGPVGGLVYPGGKLSYVPSAALAVRRNSLEAVDGFDEALRYGEDVDLVWRLIDRGDAVRYEPQARVAHRCRADLGSWLAQRAGYGASAAPLAARHPGRLAPAVFSPEFGLAVLVPWLAWGVGRGSRVWPAGGVVGVVIGLGRSIVTIRRTARRLGGTPRDGDGPTWDDLVRALRLNGAGHVSAAGSTATAVRRVWWPLVAAALVAPRRASSAGAGRAGVSWALARHGAPCRVVGLRPVLAAALLWPTLDRWHHPVNGLLDLLDDLAYGWGVWRGMWRERSLAPLRPTVR